MTKFNRVANESRHLELRPISTKSLPDFVASSRRRSAKDGILLPRRLLERARSALSDQLTHLSGARLFESPEFPVRETHPYGLPLTTQLTRNEDLFPQTYCS